MYFVQYEFSEPVVAKSDIVSREVSCGFADYKFRRKDNLISVEVNGETRNVSSADKAEILKVLSSTEYKIVLCDYSLSGIYFSTNNRVVLKVVRLFLKP